MSRLATAREELIAIAVGDQAVLLDRLEALIPLLNETRSSLVDAARELVAKVQPLRSAMHQIAADEQSAAIRYIREQVENTAIHYRRLEIEALQAAGRAVLKDEVGKTLQKAVASLQDLVVETKRREVLRTHVMTAVVSAASTAGLLMYFFPRH
jgi:hypothetical protein